MNSGQGPYYNFYMQNVFTFDHFAHHPVSVEILTTSPKGNPFVSSPSLQTNHIVGLFGSCLGKSPYPSVK